jgi:hypothetical protein
VEDDCAMVYYQARMLFAIAWVGVLVIRQACARTFRFRNGMNAMPDSLKACTVAYSNQRSLNQTPDMRLLLFRSKEWSIWY